MTAQTALGLGLALVSAALINLGFLLQHRGLARIPDPAAGAFAMLRRSLRSRTWVAGQATGWVGFAAQIAAVALAPLAIVQAFTAGGLALSVPMAAGIFGYAIGRRQSWAIGAMACALAVLGFTVVSGRDHVDPWALGIAAAVATAGAVLLMSRRRALGDAAAAGVFYGVADAAIKETALCLTPLHVPTVTAWAAAACAGTLLGFMAFQRALTHGHAVPEISLMTVTTALVGLVFGVGFFGERLGSTGAAATVAASAIVVVLAAVPILVAAQTMMATADAGRVGSARRPD